MNFKFIVSIGYKTFEFDDYEDAISFSLSAIKSRTDKTDKITIEIKEED